MESLLKIYICVHCVMIFNLITQISCKTMNLGIISPTEVVEEWGCHNSIIRLTCGRLDSNIAILEATFTPNCTDSSDDDCAVLDLKRLTRAFIYPKIDKHIEEAEAGRKFLETLRRSHDMDEYNISNIIENETIYEDLNTVKTKRNLLRTSLEQLIVEYLSEFSPVLNDFNDEDYSDFLVRNRRNSFFTSNEINYTNNEYDDSSNEDVPKRIEIGSRNITISKIYDDEYENEINRYRHVFSKKFVCNNHRRRIAQLNQFELEKSLQQNDTKYEHNIRRILNYRCSGKNHCSFIFALDHPFSAVWDSGTVRIKYICMEKFRLNKYCGEHLFIGHEMIKKPNEESLSTFTRMKKGEPKAEARLGDQNFHHLKILKSSPEERLTNDSNGTKRTKNQRVFSQDFRKLKIIPSNIDDNNNDVQKIGNEFYFKNEKPARNNEPTIQIHHGIVHKEIFNIDNDMYKENIKKINISYGGNKNNKADSTLLKSTTSNLLYTTATTFDTTSETIIEETNKMLASEILSTTENAKNEIELLLPSTKSNNADTFTVIPEYKNVDDKNDDEDDSFEDFSVEMKGMKYIRKNKFRIHTSYQMTALKKPLLQGFIATVGYPKFYIGDSECNWKISAPTGQKIRITLLDLNLRNDEMCRDFIQIVDLEIGRVLFNSCSEYAKPHQIISNSHQINILVKTTSRVAYPKRGILLHYTAFGCLLPPSPQNGRLIYNTKESATYLCDPLYIFPDTASSSRKLICTVKHTWDKDLPDCIEKASIAESDILIVSRFNHSKHTPKMAGNYTDMLYDVIIPSLVIAGLFIINAVVFLVIMRYRSKRKQCLEIEQQELAQL